MILNLLISHFTPNMQELDPAVDWWKDVSEFIPMQLLTKSSSRPLEHNAEKKEIKTNFLLCAQTTIHDVWELHVF